MGKKRLRQNVKDKDNQYVVKHHNDNHQSKSKKKTIKGLGVAEIGDDVEFIDISNINEYYNDNSIGKKYNDNNNNNNDDDDDDDDDDDNDKDDDNDDDNDDNDDDDNDDDDNDDDDDEFIALGSDTFIEDILTTLQKASDIGQNFIVSNNHYIIITIIITN